MPSEDTEEDRWRRLGRLVHHRRLELGHTNQREFAAVAGVHWHTIRKLEAGDPVARRNPSWSKIEKALGWSQGSIERAWRGEQLRNGGPVMADDFADEATLAVIDVAPELTGGQIREIVRAVERIAVDRGWIIAEG